MSVKGVVGWAVMEHIKAQLFDRAAPDAIRKAIGTVGFSTATGNELRLLTDRHYVISVVVNVDKVTK